MPPPLSSHGSHRTANGQGPAASQTAAVLEYKCLFSHTIRKKQKTWNDGFLTFHAFNNRVLVFDQDRHRVGDTFVSASDNGVHDGDEITLQQGVLVQVGEPYSAREQDISQVIVTRDTPRKERATARVYPESKFFSANRGIRDILQQSGDKYGIQTASPTAEEVPAPTGPVIRPKSLKEVLKTPGGTIGRARLSNKSPYEQLHAAPNDLQQNVPRSVQECRPAGPVMQPPEKPRPTKKQRVDDGEAARERLQRSPQKTPEPTRQRPARPQPETSRSAISPPEHMIPGRGQHAASPIMLDSDDDSTQQSPIVTTPFFSRVASPVSLPKPKEKERRQAMQAAPSVSTKEVEREQPRPKKKKKKKQKEKEKEKVERRKSSSEESMEQAEPQKTTSREAQARSEPLKERSVNLLRPAVNGRRKKLMNRALLPEEYASGKSSSESRERMRSAVVTTEVSAGAQDEKASRDTSLREKLSREKSPQDKPPREDKRRKQRQLLEDISDLEGFESDVEMHEVQVIYPDMGDEEATHPAANGPAEASDTEEIPDVLLDDTPPPDVDNDPADHDVVRESPQPDESEAALTAMSTKDILGDFSFVENSELDGILDGKDAAERVEVPATPEPPASPEPQAKALSPPLEAPPLLAQEAAPPPRAPDPLAPFMPGRLVGAPRTRNPRANQPTFQPPRPVARPVAATAVAAPPAPTATTAMADPTRAPIPAAAIAPVTARRPPPPFVPPSHRSPLKRTFSAPTSDSPKQKRTLTKSYSEMRPLEQGGMAPQAASDDADCGPWSREAFDLFGWRAGDDKGIRAG